MPAFPTHAPVVVASWGDHSELKVAEDVTFSSSSMYLSLGDHAGTHVDAFCHFDADENAPSIDTMPLDTFMGPAVCLDLSFVGMRADITISALEQAERAAHVELQENDIVLLHTGFNTQIAPTSPAFYTDFSGLTQDSARWLGGRKIKMFGVEAISPGRPGRNNYLVHQVCRDMKFTHMEGLVNLDKLVGKGRFQFIGLPLKIRGGTGSPIRAVAVVD